MTHTRCMKPGSLALIVLAILLFVSTWLVASAVAKPAPLTGTPLEVQIWPGGEPGYTLFVVTVHIPENVTLPATVQVPLPKDAEVLWAGEIFGSDPTEDVELSPTVVQGQHGTVVELTAEATRTVQYEAVGAPLTVADGLTTSVFEWKQAAETGDVVISVRVPTAAGTLSIEPEPVGSPLTNDRGESLYTLRPVVLPLGANYVITTVYGPARQDSADLSQSPLLWVLAGLLAVALVALIGALLLSRHRQTLA